MNEYKEKEYHLFINVSSLEGIPVSIMEAISFGIPCIATDVGGNREIVFNGVNGTLVGKDITPNELYKAIESYILMDEERYLRYRKDARRIWTEYFDAARNYSSFVDELVKL